MPEDTITFRTDPQLKRQFLERLEQNDRNASQVFRDFMRAFIAQPSDAQLYDDWFREKVNEALNDPRKAVPSITVERRFAAKRSAALRKTRARSR
jgi:DNA-damage-inducible protein J